MNLPIRWLEHTMPLLRWTALIYVILLTGFAGILDGLILLATFGFYCPFLADRIRIPYRERYIRGR